MWICVIYLHNNNYPKTDHNKERKCLRQTNILPHSMKVICPNIMLRWWLPMWSQWVDVYMFLCKCFCFFSSKESELCFKFGRTVEWMEKCRQMKNCIKSSKRLNVSWVDESLTSNTRQAHSYGPNNVPRCNNPPWTIKNWETILWVYLASLACLCWKRNITV